MFRVLILFFLLLLLSFGLAFLATAFFRLFLTFPQGQTVTIFPVSAEGKEMESAVRFFERYGSGKQILILVDRGLTEEARRCALLLEKNDSNVFLCKDSELYTLLNRLKYAE